MQDIIKGSVVTLRPITLEDTDLICRWRNTPFVRNNFIFQETFTHEMHENWMKTKVASGEAVQFIILDNATGEPIGSVYLRDVDYKHNNAEIGIFIGEENHSRGAGSESLRMMADYGIEVLKLHRLMARIIDTNKASIRATEKAGFHVEGVFKDMVRLQGEYANVVFLARMNPDN
ncbi:MAG: GNAT family N-acetyltransferase [Clostridia bacterium]|nr:GNAT family N-acetyltransferase [Clostridia bacterium]